MKKYGCVIFAKHEPNGKPFLFEVYPMTDIKEGQKLVVGTIHGEQEATACTDSFLADERALVAIMKITGAYFPLKRVVGIEKNVFEPLSENELPF